MVYRRANKNEVWKVICQIKLKTDRTPKRHMQHVSRLRWGWNKGLKQIRIGFSSFVSTYYFSYILLPVVSTWDPFYSKTIRADNYYIDHIYLYLLGGFTPFSFWVSSAQNASDYSSVSSDASLKRFEGPNIWQAFRF